jgi:hypothetical protein
MIMLEVVSILPTLGQHTCTTQTLCGNELVIGNTRKKKMEYSVLQTNSGSTCPGGPALAPL